MFRTSIGGVALALAVVSVAAAQDVNPALVTACVQSQQQAMMAVDGANRRIELARQTNQPAAMRGAMDDLQLVLSSMRTQLAPCATLQAAAAPAAQGMANMPGHNMVNKPAATPSTAGATAPAAAPAADPHGGHVMPAAPQARPARAPAAAAAARATPQRPAEPAAPQGHDMANMPGHDMANMSTGASSPASAVDLPTGPEELACTTKVDPKTAPRAAYAGKTYYFCSIAERDRFVKDPAAYRPK